ncbi:MAG: Uncharacterised protein [Methanobacteriota archaeon]|nr:MAG: Uncharacterised protein [Euryarchaeota archaeon]
MALYSLKLTTLEEFIASSVPIPVNVNVAFIHQLPVIALLSNVAWRDCACAGYFKDPASRVTAPDEALCGAPPSKGCMSISKVAVTPTLPAFLATASNVVIPSANLGGGNAGSGKSLLKCSPASKVSTSNSRSLKLFAISASPFDGSVKVTMYFCPGPKFEIVCVIVCVSNSNGSKSTVTVATFTAGTPNLT